MQKRASILLISSWVLSLLVIFALSLGFRAQIALKLSDYQRDSLSAYFLAKAGINRAIYELSGDLNAYDAFSESWADNEKIFRKISPGENPKADSSVSYTGADGEKIYGAMDEQSKIDINNSSQKVLEELFNSKGLGDDAKGLSALLREWISSAVETEAEKKIFKNAPLSSDEELLLVLEYFYKDKLRAQEAYKGIENFITVYSDGKININTVQGDILAIFARACAQSEDETAAAASLVDKVIKLRQEKRFFKDIRGISFDASFDTSELSLWNKISAFLSVKSNYFKISAHATVKEASKEVNVIFKRDSKEIAYWHQN
ncbi:MAG: type II secretion system protein GspK [Candidatus Omnitrophica bacterium]|nr:type II secretion system protein GspK [Candidatus Omnitrophota bacterium]